MSHFVFAFYLLSFFSGILSSLLVQFLYHRYRSPLLKKFFYFLMNLTLLEMVYLIVIYLQIYRHRVSIYPPLELALLISLLDLFLILNGWSLTSLAIKHKGRHILRPVSIIGVILVLLSIPAAFIMNTGAASDFRDISSVLYFFILFAVAYYHRQRLDHRIFDRFKWLFRSILLFFPIIILAVLIKGFSLFRVFPQAAFSFSIIFFIANLITIQRVRKSLIGEDSDKTEKLEKQYGLTKREMEIISFVQSGLSNRQIAERLFISPKTVGNHLYAIFKKTGVQNRYELIKFD